MKVLVLAGGFDQIALIEELKKRGNQVILADYFQNPPAKKYADQHFQISTLDEEAVLNLAKKEKVDLITTACTDQALLTVAKVSEILGLPCYISYEKALNVTNKQYMKRIFVENDIPTAKYYLVHSLTELTEKTLDIEFPLVVKPCDCNSSKGVIKVFNYDEMIKSVEKALEMSRSNTAIVETFQSGVELSVDVWIDNEGAKLLSASTTSKNKNNKNAFTIYQSKYPVKISPRAWENIQETANKISKAFELNNCPLLIQLIVNNDDIHVIEFSARMGGGTKYRLIEKMSGINIMNVYTNRILGDTKQIINPVHSKKYIELNYVYGYNGTYKELINFENAKNQDLIEEYYTYKEPGAIIEKATTSSDRIAGFLIIDDTPNNLKERRKKAINYLDVLNTDGKSMMIKSIYSED